MFLNLKMLNMQLKWNTFFMFKMKELSHKLDERLERNYEENVFVFFFKKILLTKNLLLFFS